MRQCQKKASPFLPKARREISGFRRELHCDKPAFDRFTFAHILVGVYAACIAIIVSTMFFLRLGYSRELANQLVAVLTSIALGGIILLDVIEHTSVKNNYFKKVLGDKNWCEGLKNTLADLILAFIAFVFIFMPTIYYVEDIRTMMFIGLFPFFLMPLFILIIWNCEHKKWKGFFREEKKKQNRNGCQGESLLGCGKKNK